MTQQTIKLIKNNSQPHKCHHRLLHHGCKLRIAVRLNLAAENYSSFLLLTYIPADSPMQHLASLATKLLSTSLHLWIAALG
jgi:hypothetical protein